ncbi:hypothetical protein MGG_15525 [Pyricularia oryzae 70-15]|uniref:Uncharacterized protein n=3 Tax=Pyricularia oryzae TaxID=318829 RepID=G4MYV8_PYRO7|nr:uncharacterized protein MGG_15525 [Pyricularia oryzae 70-15]EHA53619.1 hypothetical protein MGG_15525 [Pyricularia oryzae 70-15]ELQ33284.1 hypothetical protein OOU_Y34scaffold00979g68 [Pyricularia oryzae Y34]
MGGKRTGAVRARKRANAWCLRTWVWVLLETRQNGSGQGSTWLSRFPEKMWCSQVPDPGITRTRQGDPFLKRPRNIKPPRFLGFQLLPRSNGVAFEGGLRWNSRRKAGADGQKSLRLATVRYLITLYVSNTAFTWSVIEVPSHMQLPITTLNFGARQVPRTSRPQAAWGGGPSHGLTFTIACISRAALRPIKHTIRKISAQDFGPWILMTRVAPRSTSFSVALSYDEKSNKGQRFTYVVNNPFDSLVNYMAWPIKSRCNLPHQTPPVAEQSCIGAAASQAKLAKVPRDHLGRWYPYGYHMHQRCTPQLSRVPKAIRLSPQGAPHEVGIQFTMATEAHTAH